VKDNTKYTAVEIRTNAEAASYWMKRAETAEAERDRLRDALAFYADQSDYVSPFTGGMGKLWNDCGGVARAALKGDTP
jgi:hypothetical protein